MRRQGFSWGLPVVRLLENAPCAIVVCICPHAQGGFEADVLYVVATRLAKACVFKLASAIVVIVLRFLGVVQACGTELHSHNLYMFGPYGFVLTENSGL